MRKVVNWCKYSRNWIVWDRQRREVVGYFTTKHEAELCASQCEMF